VRSFDLEDIYAFRLPSDPQVSPDGSLVAFVITTAHKDEDENRSAIWIVDADGDAPPRQVTHGPQDSAPRWSPDGSRLAFVAGGRGDGVGLRVLPMAGGESITAATGRSIGSPAWSPDGARLAYCAVVGEVDPKAPVVVRRLGFKADGAGLIRELRRHVFVVAAGGGESRQLTEGDFTVSVGPEWSPDGTRLAWAASTEADRDLEPALSIFVSDPDGGAPKRVTEPPSLASSITWTADGASLIVAGAERRAVGHTRLFSVAADGGTLAPLAPEFDRNVMVGAPGYPGARPQLSPDGSTVVFCARDEGCTHVYEVPVAGGAPTKVLGDASLNIGGVSVGSRVAVVAGTPATPGEVYVDGQSRTSLFADELADVEIVAPQSRMFMAPDGTAIHGWVMRRPDAPTLGPLLLDIHGGPHNSWNGNVDVLHLYHQGLVALGWTVLILNPRGSDGYGEAFYAAVSGGWGTSDEADFLSALDELVAEGVADPARLVVTGYSYGGFMSCWLSARHDRFAAAIPGGIPVNLTSMTGTADLGSYLAELEVGGLAPGAPGMIECSPLTYVDGVRAPTLILHGESDDRCPVSQAEEWFSALRLRRVEVELVRYPGASHLFIALGRPSHRIDYCRRLTEWAIDHTKGND